MNQVKTATRRTDARRVPIGWSAVKLGSVCSIQNGFAFEGSRFTPSRGTALIRIRDLKTNAPSVYYDGPIDPAYLVPPGGLLVGMDGEFRCYEWRGPSALLNQRVCRLHADPQRLDAAFLQLALDDYLRAIEEETGFTTVKHLSSRQIGDIQLALPPLPEQRRIAEMLKEQLAAVERARAAAKARLEAAGEVVETQLRDAFDGSEMKHWPRAALEDLAGGPDAFADGPFGSHLKTEHYRPSGVRVIRLQNIGRGTFLDSDRVYVSLDHFAGLERHSVRGGDVVVAALGSGARPAGRACVVPEHLAPALVKADCFRVRLPREVILPEYLAAYLNSPACLAVMAERMRGATRPRVTLTMVRRAEIPLPPIPEQRRITSVLAEQAAAATHLAMSAASGLRAVEDLPAALLRRAFHGQS